MEPPISPMITMPDEEFNEKIPLRYSNVTFSVGVIEEHLDYVDMLCARERIAPDTDTERLAKTNVGSLCNGLVSQCAGTRHNT
jgi:hypothetical protein